MKSNTILWVVLAVVAVYFLSQRKPSTQTQALNSAANRGNAQPSGWWPGVDASSSAALKNSATNVNNEAGNIAGAVSAGLGAITTVWNAIGIGRSRGAGATSSGSGAGAASTDGTGLSPSSSSDGELSQVDSSGNSALPDLGTPDWNATGPTPYDSYGS